MTNLPFNREVAIALIMLDEMLAHGQEPMTTSQKEEKVSEVLAEVDRISKAGKLGILIREMR